jgi:hypothetical protein
MQDDEARRRLLVSAAIIALVIIFIALLVTILFKTKKDNASKSGGHDINSTTFYSPISQAEDNFTANYSGDVAPNLNAVQQQFKIFNAQNVPIPTTIKDDLNNLLPSALQRVVTPTYATTFVHLDKNNVKCDKDNTDCTIGVYIDSPESYYSVHITTGSVPSITATQQAWKGIN